MRSAPRPQHTCIHPLAVFLEANSRHVAGVAVVAHDRLRVIGVDVKQPYLAVAGCSDVLLLSCDLQLVDLGVGILQRAVADATGRLPEANCVVIASCRKHHR